MERYQPWLRLMTPTGRGVIRGFFGLLVLVLVAGCASNTAAPAAQPAAPAAQATTAPVEPTTAAVQPSPAAMATELPAPQVLPATGVTPSPAAAGGTLVNLAQINNFGKFLVDDKGMTLYLYTKDTPNTSNCYDQCAAAWPPLYTTGAPAAGTGVTASLLGTTNRKDGKTQVTYNGWPLYYYVKDQKAGDITGQGVGGVWFVVSPRGSGMTSAKAPAQGTAAPQSQATAAPAATPTGPAALKLSQNDQLGQFLVDDKGMTLYLYTKDTPNTSNCYDKCATAWPPLYTNGAATAGSGLDASLLGTTTRKDGTVQVTYNGWPLYYWFKDQKPGDTTGQWVGSVWFVVSPKGEKITAGQPPATTAPAAAAAATPGSGSSQAGAAQTMTVGMKGMAFAPQTLTVAPGTTVEWKNDDSLAHTVTADNGSFDSGNLNAGATFKFTFTKAGTYPYYCRYHGSAGGNGMAGTIIVK